MSLHAQVYEDAKYAGSIYFIKDYAKIYYKQIGIDRLDSSKELVVEFIYYKPVKLESENQKVTSIVYYFFVNCKIDRISAGVVNHFNGDDLLSCAILSGEIKKEEKYYQFIVPYLKEICSK